MEEIINPNEYGGLIMDNQEVDAVKQVILNEKIFRYATGKESCTDLFEKDICNKFGVQYALGVNSGTSALKVALKAIGVQLKDRVLISSYTFLATATAVIALGAIPIPIDFDLNYGLNLKDLENEIKKGCKAIIVVHLQGKCFDVRPIIKLKEKYGVSLIEDACQAMETKNKGKFSGTFGDLGVFSFQQNKPITCGEGGVIVTNSIKYYNIARNYADMGSVRDYYPSWDKEGALIGDNYRMNNIQSAILRVQLSKMAKMQEIQMKNKEYILKKIKINKVNEKIINKISNDDTGINILFLTTCKEKADICIEKAKDSNIEIRRLWNKPYYLHQVIRNEKLTPQDLNKGACTLAETIADNLISISLPPILKNEDLESIIRLINQLIEEGSL